jgi:hypothetical protein
MDASPGGGHAANHGGCGPTRTRWRLVCQTEHLDDDEAGIAASVPPGLRVLRVRDDRPDQGQQYQSRIIAVRGKPGRRRRYGSRHDLIDMQVRTTGTDGTDRDEQAVATAGAQRIRPPGTVLALQDSPVRDGVVRVSTATTVPAATRPATCTCWKSSASRC